MAKQNKSTRHSRKISSYIVVAVLILIVGVVGYGIANPHPGYSKLEKELNSLKLPASWEEIGPRTGEKDGWYGICRDIDLGCPTLHANYNLGSVSNDVVNEFEEVLISNGYVVSEKVKFCATDLTRECRVAGNKNGTRISLSVRRYTVNVGQEIMLDVSPTPKK